MTKKSIVILSYTNKYFFAELTYRLNINIHLIFIQYFVYVSNFYLLYINQLIQKLFSEQHQFNISMLLYISLVHLTLINQTIYYLNQKIFMYYTCMSSSHNTNLIFLNNLIQNLKASEPALL